MRDWISSAVFVFGGVMLAAIVAAFVFGFLRCSDTHKACRDACGGEDRIYEFVTGMDVPGHCICWTHEKGMLRYVEVNP